MKTRRFYWGLFLCLCLFFNRCWAADEHDHDHGEKDHAHEHQHAHDEKEHGDEHHHEHGDEAGHEGHSDEVKLTPEAIKANGIRVESVKRRQLTGIITVPARVSFNAEAMAHVGTPVEGRITAIRAKLGDRVNKGDVLMTIESPALSTAQSEFLQQQAALEVAQTSLEVAKTAYERAKKLYEGNGISLGEFQRREGEFKIAQGAATAAASVRHAAENRLHQFGFGEKQVQRLQRTSEIDPELPIKAPIAGEVVEREATLGEIVGPEQERLLMLADTSKLWLLADVPEARMPAIAIGAPARATFASLPGQVIQGRVEYLSPQINEQTRSGVVRITVPGHLANLRPGLFGMVELAAQDANTSSGSVLAVPEAAVLTVEGSPAVFVPVEGEADTFAKRIVKVGARVGAWLPIASGLKEGEPVVVEGTFTLKAELGKSGAAHEH